MVKILRPNSPDRRSVGRSTSKRVLLLEFAAIGLDFSLLSRCIWEAEIDFPAVCATGAVSVFLCSTKSILGAPMTSKILTRFEILQINIELRSATWWPDRTASS